MCGFSRDASCHFPDSKREQVLERWGRGVSLNSTIISRVVRGVSSRRLWLQNHLFLHSCKLTKSKKLPSIRQEKHSARFWILLFIFLLTPFRKTSLWIMQHNTKKQLLLLVSVKQATKQTKEKMSASSYLSCVKLISRVAVNLETSTMMLSHNPILASAALWGIYNKRYSLPSICQICA